jgi:hypothetical protein
MERAKVRAKVSDPIAAIWVELRSDRQLQDLQGYCELYGQAGLPSRSTPGGRRSCQRYPPVSASKEGDAGEEATRIKGKSGGGEGFVKILSCARG